jgi:hypothetical protein
VRALSRWTFSVRASRSSSSASSTSARSSPGARPARVRAAPPATWRSPLEVPRTCRLVQPRRPRGHRDGRGGHGERSLPAVPARERSATEHQRLRRHR